MGHELINPVAVAQDTLMRLENNLTLFKSVNREFDKEFAVPGNKIGYTYNARVPVRFRGRRGDAMQPEDIRELPFPITVNSLWGQDLDISDQDLTMTIDRFGERYVESASETVANMIDSEGCDQAVNLFNHVGTPGTTPATLATYTSAGVVLANHGTPKGKMRSIVLSPEMEAAVLGFGSNLFNPAKEISRQYEEGTMGIAVGFKWSMDQNIRRQVIGAVAGTPVVSGANQSGAVINTSGWTAGATLLQGDIVTFALVNGVNPISYRDYGQLRTFTVREDTTADGAGLMAIKIAPDINADVTSVFQTVTAMPGNNAAIKVYGVASGSFANISGISTPQALAMHRDCMTCVIARLEKPGGMEWSEEISNPRAGLSLRLVRGYSIKDNRKYTRLDVLGGWATPRPELGCRVSG